MSVALSGRRPIPGVVFGVLGLLLLALGAVITIIAGIVEFFIWLPYDNGFAEMAAWAVLAAVPSVVICLLWGLGWALPALLASLTFSSIGMVRSGRLRWLSILTLLITVIPAGLSLMVVVGLFALGAAPWSLPPG